MAEANQATLAFHVGRDYQAVNGHHSGATQRQHTRYLDHSDDIDDDINIVNVCRAKLNDKWAQTPGRLRVAETVAGQCVA